MKAKGGGREPRAISPSYIINSWSSLGAKYLLVLPRSVKCSIVILVDVFFCILTTWLAFYLRLGEFVKLDRDLASPVVLSVILVLPIFAAMGLYRAIFRHSGWPAIVAVGRAIILYGLAYVSIVMVIGLDRTPRTIGVIQPLLLFFAVAGSRVLASYYLSSMFAESSQKNAARRSLIYGAGSTGRKLAAALNAGHEIRAIGFLDDDENLHGHILNELPIFSPDNLCDLIESKGVTHVLMAMPSVGRYRLQELVKKLSSYDVTFHTLPSITDLVDGRVTISDLRDLQIDDLLGREIVVANPTLVAKKISERIVLVTGAGGSIGSELCRQIIELNPKKLLLLDISEFALYTIYSDLEDIFEVSGDHRRTACILPLLGSVLDEERMREIMDAWLPDTVYHAAAYKHVPLVEHNCVEGIRNNVFGTLNIAKVAIEKGVSDFVLISTDKAVRPTNVMGASKRLAELCLQALQEQQFRLSESKTDSTTFQGVKSNQTRETKFSMVRFGNVLDSSGSVIPKFRKQILDGGPITLTHPEITRYFMTKREAAQLVIQASAMAKGADVFILEMGESVKIADLARRMVELSGLSMRDSANPNGDIDIAITGLRPGEKLYEELLLGDDPKPTLHPKIKRSQDPFISWEELEEDLHTLEILLSNSDNIKVIVTLLQKLVAGYQPSGEVVDWVFSEQINHSNCMAENKKALRLGSTHSKPSGLS